MRLCDAQVLPYIFTQKKVLPYILMYVYVCTCIYTYIHAYIYIYMCVCVYIIKETYVSLAFNQKSKIKGQQ